jgi:hypothetical protein
MPSLRRGLIAKGAHMPVDRVIYNNWSWEGEERKDLFCDS